MNIPRRDLLLLLLLGSVCAPLVAQHVHGDLKQWHKVVIDFEGPLTFETDTPNPFTAYRLDVTFTGPGGQTYHVPGYYAADGRAAETSADSGNVWRVNFAPDAPGAWHFDASFVQGPNIAAAHTGGESAGYFDGASGTFDVTVAEGLSEKDFRRQGKLVYAGDHYLRFMGSGAHFIKAGANSPEVFLEYRDFDNTPTVRIYPLHIADWQAGDPTWQEDKGKGIIGAVNYLSDVGVNALYFLTMNAYGDGNRAWPWVHRDSVSVYDCSKLDQWEIVFAHMTAKGIMPHIVLTETENESYFEIEELGAPGGFATRRKIYYREMVARFGHHPALTWNIGEENGWADGEQYRIANTDAQRKQFADWLRALTPYPDHISIHNGPSTDDTIFEPLLGWESLTGPAFQWGLNTQIHDKILTWRQASAANGHKWVVSMDEAWLSPALGTLPFWRKHAVWGTLMAGGAGVELYVGAGLDVQEQHYRPYAAHYAAAIRAASFFTSHVPFEKMAPDDAFTETGWALAQADSTYLVYLINGGSSNVNLPEGTYAVRWFDPRNGGALQAGSVAHITGPGTIPIGTPPDTPDADWACLITRVDPTSIEVDRSGLVPAGVDLKQNHPNPFNPSTHITYSLARPAHVTLRLYDVLGREVQTLVQGYRQPNTYAVHVDAGALSEGVYFYRLQAGDAFTEARKMIRMQ